MGFADQNYSVEKSQFGALALDPDIAAALVSFLSDEPDTARVMHGTTVRSKSSAAFSPLQAPDILTLDLHAACREIVVDLARMPKGIIDTLDAVMFRNDSGDHADHSGPQAVYDNLVGGAHGSNTTDIHLKLSTFSGVIVLADGDNRVSGERAGPVALESGLGRDTITTGAGSDTLVTGAGDDVIAADRGDDLIKAGAGDDSVDAGMGRDTVHTGGGSDTVALGSGDDLLVLGPQDVGAGSAAVVVDGGADSDTLDLTAFEIQSVRVSGTGLEITLNDGTIVFETNVEQFLYTFGAETRLVGGNDLLDDFPGG